MSEHLQEVVDSARNLRNALIAWSRGTRALFEDGITSDEIENFSLEGEQLGYNLALAKYKLFKALDNWDGTSYIEEVEKEFDLKLNPENSTDWMDF